MVLKELQYEIARVEKLPRNVRSVILDFREFLVIDQLKERRQLFHIQKARVIQEKIGLLPFDESKVRECVTWLMKQDYEAWTIAGYKLFFRKFWVFRHGDEIPKSVSQLFKFKRPKDNGKVSDDLITEEELARLKDACRSTRDKTILQLLYDSGIRAGELLNLKLGDVKFLDDKVRLKVYGKTGERTVIVLGDSIRALLEYQNVHPSTDPESWLFPDRTNAKKPMNAASLQKMLNSACKKSGVRHVYPHLFRHTRATLLARSVAEAPLESQMGWVHGSNMTRTYVHLSLRDQEDAISAAYGHAVDKQEVKIEIPLPRTCPRCHTENSTGSKFCNTCGMNLSLEDSLEENLTLNDARAKIEKLENKLQDIVNLTEPVIKAYARAEKEIQSSKWIDEFTKRVLSEVEPEFKGKILTAIVKAMLKSPELSKKFKAELARK